MGGGQLIQMVNPQHRPEAISGSAIGNLQS
jgi:hypothetical protein